jgi:hypothetical protein
MPVTPIATSTDAWGDQAQPNINHGQDGLIRLNGSGSAIGRRGFVQFPLPRGLIWLGGHARSCLLRVWLGGAWSGQTITVSRVTEPWAEDQLTWNNQPAVDATHAVTSAAITGAAGDLVEIDITDLINDAVNGSPYYGLRIAISGTTNRHLVAAENDDQTMRARVILDWTLLPEGPINLKPSDGGVISVGAPILMWQFAPRDYTGETAQAYCQVQVDDATDFATPTFDTGKIANTAHYLDLSATAYVANAAGTTRYYRVRVWDDAGNVSDWSDVASWTRQTKGTLAITSPGTTVPETTPPITHTFTGRTQESKEIFLYQLDGTKKILKWHYPRTVTSSLSTSVPQRYAIKTGEQYTVVVRVWDTLQRQSIPGDKDYVEASKTFSYNRAGTIADVTNLTAVQFGSSPGVVLTWHRTSKPNFFCLRRDGKEVVDYIDPDAVDQGGGTYSMIYWAAQPGVLHTYEVEAVELGVGGFAGAFIHSDINDTDTLKIAVTSRWLIDETDNTACNIQGDQEIDWDVRQQGTTYDIPKRRDPVQVIAGIGGYTGTVDGELTAAGKDAFEKLRGRAPRNMRLVLSNYSFVVQLETGAPVPTPIPDNQLYHCKFDFNQVDEYTFSVPGLS